MQHYRPCTAGCCSSPRLLAALQPFSASASGRGAALQCEGIHSAVTEVAPAPSATPLSGCLGPGTPEAGRREALAAAATGSAAAQADRSGAVIEAGQQGGRPMAGAELARPHRPVALRHPCANQQQRAGVCQAVAAALKRGETPFKRKSEKKAACRRHPR